MMATDMRPGTSGDDGVSGRPRGGGRVSVASTRPNSVEDQLHRSQLNLAAALLDAATKGSRLTEGQKAEVHHCKPTGLRASRTLSYSFVRVLSFAAARCN